MDTIKMLYIDDSPEAALAEYLDRTYINEEFNTEYSDIIFDPQTGYDALLKDPKVQSANIVFIDSRLFENTTALGNKFSGEEVKFVLRKIFPYIEVIVVTQNEVDPGLEKLAKYNPVSGKTSSEYYDELVPPLIEQAIKNIKQYRLLASKMEQNNSWETLLKEKVIASLNGTSAYDELTKADIDNLVNAFKEIQEQIDGCGL